MHSFSLLLGLICLLLMCRFAVGADEATTKPSGRTLIDYFLPMPIKGQLSDTTWGAVPWGDSAASTTAVSPTTWWHEVTGDAAPLKRAIRLVGTQVAHDIVLEHAWVISDVDKLNTVIEAADDLTTTLFPPVLWEKHLQQAALRTGWTRDALCVFFACRSPACNGHAHIDPMGFDFTAFGQSILVDPGFLTYREDADRRRFKPTAADNTLLINNRDAFEYKGLDGIWLSGRTFEVIGLTRFDFHIRCRRCAYLRIKSPSLSGFLSGVIPPNRPKAVGSP